MLIRSFADANWNPSVVARLHAFGCEGLEIISPGVTRSTATAAAFAEITERTRRIFSGAEYWAISGHEIPQPKTRIVSYRKLWKSVHMSLSGPSNDLAEWCVSTAEGPKYFGIAKLPLFKKEDLFFLLNSFETSWVVVLDGMHAAQALATDLHAGWEGFYTRCPENLLNFTSRNDAILIRSFEASDGRENGVLAIARVTTIQRLLQHKN